MKKISSKIKRKIRNRKKLRDVNTNKLRITVFKSTKNISAQIIDDKISKTLVSASSTEKEIKKNKTKINGIIYRIFLFINIQLRLQQDHQEMFPCIFCSLTSQFRSLF